MRAKRPARQRKADRLTGGNPTTDQLKCDYAIAPLDRMANQMDRKWGVDRLPELVPPATATRYGAAMAFLNECIADADPDKAAAAAENCMRGLQAMDAEATAAGQPPARGDVWQVARDGIIYGILRDDREWPAAAERHPGLVLVSLTQVANALDAYEDLALRDVKRHFPKSTVKPPKLPADFFAKGGDQIPF